LLPDVVGEARAREDRAAAVDVAAHEAVAAASDVEGLGVRVVHRRVHREPSALGSPSRRTGRRRGATGGREQTDESGQAGRATGDADERARGGAPPDVDAGDVVRRAIHLDANLCSTEARNGSAPNGSAPRDV
jgi:hypothetical protein